MERNRSSRLPVWAPLAARNGAGTGQGRKLMGTRPVENPVSASASWCASERSRWDVIAIGGNARNTGPKQGFDGPGGNGQQYHGTPYPERHFATSIDVISARKVATDDQRSTREHGRSLPPMGTGPTKSTKLVPAAGPFHLLNHGLRSMFASLQRRYQGAFATALQFAVSQINSSCAARVRTREANARHAAREPSPFL